jgi:predicted PurR-regulated permease PerM
MAFNLSPFPKAIFFAVVFTLACSPILWKLRKRDKLYSFLFKATLISAVLLIIALVYSVIAGILG